MGILSNSEDPPQLLPFNGAIGKSRISNDVLPFSSEHGGEAAEAGERILALMTDTGERLTLACEECGYDPKDVERIMEASDTFVTTIEPRQKQTRERYLERCEEEMGLVETNDDEVHAFVEYDGATISPSFHHAVQKHEVHYLDHHHPDDAPGTRSCCHQMMSAVESGNFVRTRNLLKKHVIHERFVDCDQDVCLTRWLMRNWRKLLANPELMEKIRPLVEMEDELDIYAGFVPIDFENEQESELYHTQAWIFEPYDAWKNAKKPDGEMESVMQAVMQRIDRFVDGTAEPGKIDKTFVELARGQWWIRIDETSGSQARQDLMNSVRVVTISADMDDGFYRYSISQVHEDFVPTSTVPVTADLEGMCECLNQLEGIPPESTDKWGGRKGIVIGSPQGRHSRIPPERLDKIVQFFLYPLTPPPNRTKRHSRERFADVISIYDSNGRTLKRQAQAA